MSDAMPEVFPDSPTPAVRPDAPVTLQCVDFALTVDADLSDAEYINRGAPLDASFPFGQDITMGECDFADSTHPAELNTRDALSTGVWVAEWDWEIGRDDDGDPDWDEEYDAVAARYSPDRWRRAGADDFAAFGIPLHVPATADTETT